MLPDSTLAELELMTEYLIAAHTLALRDEDPITLRLFEQMLRHLAFRIANEAEATVTLSTGTYH